MANSYFERITTFTKGLIARPTLENAEFDAILVGFDRVEADMAGAIGTFNDRGDYDASVNAFPATGGSGTAGAIVRGDWWFITVPGTLGGELVGIGDSIRALSNTPGQTAGNWGIIHHAESSGYRWGGTATGTVNAITITTTLTTADHVPGLAYQFITSGANTTAVTFAPNGLSAKALVKNGNVALGAGDIQAGALVTATYDGTNYHVASVVGLLESDKASQAQAQAGLASTVWMTPERVAQYVSYVLASQAQAIAGESNTTLMTPLRGGQQLSALGVKKVNTIAALRLITPTANETIQLLGYTAAGDTDMPLYRGVTSGGPYVDNLGSIIVPTGGDGSAAHLSLATEWRSSQWGGNITAIVTAAGSTNTHLIIDSEITLTAAVTIPSTMSVRFARNGKINLGNYNLIFSGSQPGAGEYLIFNCAGSGRVTGLMLAKSAWFGFSTVASAATNATALQFAIDSEASDVTMHPGSFSYSTGLTIDRAIRFTGSGSCSGEPNSTGGAGTSTTKLTYTGSSRAITLVGSGTEGRENIHLRDFSLVGTASGAVGIYVGLTTNVSKSSIKNVHVSSFTGTGSSGIRLAKTIELYLENVYTQGNYDGIVNLAGDVATTIRTMNVHSRTNTRRGFFFEGTLSGSTFHGLLAEGNQYEGLYIYGNGVDRNDFFGYYSEANQEIGGDAPVVITGASGNKARGNNFYGGYIADAAGVGACTILRIKLGYADYNSFHNMSFPSYSAGFMEVSAYTEGCVLYTQHPVEPGNITNNHINGLIVQSALGGNAYNFTIANDAVQSLNNTVGIVLVTDTTNNHSAIFALNGSAAPSEMSDPDNKFSATSGTASSINFYYSAGYAIQNKSGGEIVLKLTMLNNGGI